MYSNDSMRLWYKQPAKIWEEALPVGNGRLGGMVFGGIGLERIALNDDTLWSNSPRGKTDKNRAEDIKKIRELMFRGENAKAEKHLETTLYGPWCAAYEPLGNLYIQTDQPPYNRDAMVQAEQAEEYCRDLVLGKAIATVRYRTDGILYTREVISSVPDDVIAVRITADRPGSINITAYMDSPLKHCVECADNSVVIMRGSCPTHSEPDYNFDFAEPIVYDPVKESVHFEARLTARISGGMMYTSGAGLKIAEADEVLLILAAASSFNGFDKMPVSEGRDESAACRETLERTAQKSWDALKKSHIEEYAPYFGRISLDLDGSENVNIPTDERLQRLRDGHEDPHLAALFFQYGRYLLVASSRPGTQPANAQGLWCKDVRPAWSCNYTTNINAQMNYWPAEVCGLSECHMPFIEFVRDLSVPGKATAAIFGCGGWAANHNSDLWRLTDPVAGSARHAVWPVGGAWSCRHLWEHYLYSGDREYLNNIYPVIKSAAEFCLDWLVEDCDGRLTTCPSVSPENAYALPNGELCSLTIGSAMDIAIIGELFGYCAEAAALTGDSEFQARLTEAKAKLQPLRTGTDGRLMEWHEEFDEPEKGHRHVSHLYGLFPSDAITPENQPELFEACRKSLMYRLENGGGHTGWSCAWIINLFARLRDGEAAYRYTHHLLTKSVYPNLFDAHPPFQIDGNFGGISGIAEMLMQSHNNGKIDLLPALPSCWKTGAFKGLCARGGYVVDVAWRDGIVTNVTLNDRSGNPVSGDIPVIRAKGLAGAFYEIDRKIINQEA